MGLSPSRLVEIETLVLNAERLSSSEIIIVHRGMPDDAKLCSRLWVPICRIPDHPAMQHTYATALANPALKALVGQVGVLHRWLIWDSVESQQPRDSDAEKETPRERARNWQC